MRTQTSNNLKIGFGLSILLLILSSVISYISIRNLLKSTSQVKHTQEVSLAINHILFTLKDAESGQRGFLISGDEEFLRPFYATYDSVNQELDRVLMLTGDNPLQQKNAKKLQYLIAKRVNRMQEMVVKKKSGQPIDVNDMHVGKGYMDSIRHLVSTMTEEEQRLLTIRTEKQEKFSLYTPVIIILAALLGIVIALVFYMKIMRDVKERIALQLKLEQKERDISERIEVIQEIAEKISHGDYHIRISTAQKDALGSLGNSLNKMAESLFSSFNKLSENEWLQSGLAGLNEKMVGEKELRQLTYQIIHFLTAYSGSHVGAIYLLDKGMLVLNNGYSLLDSCKKEIVPGEGIVGQSFQSGAEIILKDVDPAYVTVSHASGNIKPKSVLAFPIFYEGESIGVLELAAIKEYTEKDLSFIRTVIHNVGTAITSAQNHKKLQLLLEETQTQSEELQTQHSELENMNAELEAHTQKLQSSEEELRVQQEELQQSNTELEERNRIINQRNTEIQIKAEELEQSTRYKSEFMANMSHELRTPLNSILLLSRYLSENGEQNLSEDQLESAKVIYNSGTGLLDLIDELLDLSKIEAGKMELDYEQINIKELLSGINGLFTPVAKEKNIRFEVDNLLPVSTTLETDNMKLEQILKNLISNSLKFTNTGYVKLTLSILKESPSFIQFSVEDTGVGIADNKLSLIFEAFTQADGSTKRKYGGTGLGLSISRHLSRLLGGDITVSSKLEKGSIFSLVLPLAQSVDTTVELPKNIPAEAPPQPKSKPRHLATVIPQEIEDDRNNLLQGDKTILVIEDDPIVAKTLLQFARKQSYKVLVAGRGDLGVAMAKQYKPNAILLDIQLPVMDGWEVMDALKSDPETRPIPVHIMSSMEVKRESRLHGAVDFFNKPLALEQMQTMFKKLEQVFSQEPKKVLIIEENTRHAKALSHFLETFNVASTVEHHVNESIQSLGKSEVNCVILDMGLPDKNAYETLETIKQTPGMEHMPIIVFTGKNLSQAEEGRIRQYADSIVVKTAHSYQRILDEVGLFLHLVEENKVTTKKTMPAAGAMKDILAGKTILIADDDVRNIFSLTKALEGYKAEVISATDGAEALEQLELHPETDIILMDMMMPQMDGYESTTKIRQNPKFKNIPVIAVTAKAMLGDREKCIAAGASDYISKPVDTDQLISLLRVWLYDK